MRLRLALLPAAALALASLLSTPPAQACWDGYAAAIGRVSLSVADEDAWSPPTIREIALWGTRIDALLPPGTRLDSELGTVTFCTTIADGECGAAVTELPYGGDELPALFGEMAIFTHAGAKEVSRIMALSVTPLTVQVFAGKSEARASRLAESIDASGAANHGFINVGGFPANNDMAHVVAGKDGAGNPIHRVFVGAFLSRADAASTEASVRKALGLKGFVRPL